MAKFLVFAEKEHFLDKTIYSEEDTYYDEIKYDR